MNGIRNFDAKASRLQSLVAEAADQVRIPPSIRNPWGPEFDGFRKNSPLEGLADLLQTTDAILVLDELLKGRAA